MNSVAILILLGLFVLLLIIRVPITFTLAISSIVTAVYLKIPLMAIIQRIVQGVNIFALLAIPFFVLAGAIMSSGGISNRLIAFSNVLIGRFPGGLAQVNVLASMFFGGISGSTVADVSSIGTIMIPMMKKKGYETDFSVGITVTSACQGVIIPPSHNMILYAMAAGGVSVGRLFLGGVIPGIILGISLMVISYIIALIKRYPRENRYSLRQSWKVTRDAFLGLLTAVIIIGGVISGVFTATESAAIACLYAFIITFFVYREIPLRAFGKILQSCLSPIAMVMSLIAAASAFGWLLAYLKIPAIATRALLDLTENRVLLLLLINALLILLGTIMDMAPLILITTPILYPVIVDSLGMSPIQFGVMLMLNLGIGLTTPPVGSALFVGCAIGKISIEKVTKSMLPLYAMMLIVLLLVTFVPGLVLFIPNQLMGK